MVARRPRGPPELGARRGRRSTEASAVLAAVFASAAIGCRPQLAVPLLPALAIALFLCFRTWRQRAIAIAVFTLVSLCWLLPLVQATYGWRGFIDYEWTQAKYVVAHDAAASRGSKTLLRVAVRFILRAWGSTITIAAVGLLCALGVLPFLRAWRRCMLPLAVFTFFHLGFATAAMDPADAVRYSLPALPLFALLAAFGLRVLRIVWIGTAVLVALAFWYVSPILIDRVTSPSPMVAATRFISATMPRNTVVLYQAGTRSHVEWLLPGYRRRYLERAMREIYDSPDPAVVIIDGTTSDPDARTFAWRESQAFTKMTRNFGRRVTVDPLRPEERFLRVRGIHHLESAPDESPWRWLDPVAVLRLPPLGKSQVTLTFDLSPDAPYDTNEVKILVDGREAGRAIVKKTPVSVTVPTGNEIEIRAARSFRPDDVLHNQDKRLLAVQLVGLAQQ
jgi:hypothetical protein